MSPESVSERSVLDTIASAIRRARVLALLEALGWGLTAAAVSRGAGGLVAVAVGVWRWRAASRTSIVAALERVHPASRNLFVTADEIARGVLTAKPQVRARIFDEAAVNARQLDLRKTLTFARVIRVMLVAALAWTAATALDWWRSQPGLGGGATSSQSASPAVASTRLKIDVAIQPPAYTSQKETRASDPEQVAAIEGSSVVLSIDSSASRVAVEHDGAARDLARGADGRFTDRVRVTKTGYLLVTTDAGARRMMPVVVSPDALPAVRLTAPGRDLVYSGGNPRIAFDARATDDFGLRSLVLRYTKVTGSGENFEFREGEIPLAVKAASARDWSGSASRSLAELDLKDGDMLVYRAVAADTRPGDGSAASDAFFIEISKLGVAAGDAFTLPEEESKYALSQQMLIVKTERLQQRLTAVPQGEFAEQALNLAVEQRMIRAEFVFMLGGEINDEEVEAEQSVELQAGRLQNRGQRDLRAATIAMSQAEKLLTGANTRGALVAERAAVTALQRAFSRDRYILRALATRSQLDLARRMTGGLDGAASWRRIAPDVPANRRTALLQGLLRGISELIAVAARPSGGAEPDTFRQQALVLSEEAVRIDPSAAALRQTATSLQRAADATDPGARAKALADAASGAAAEARRAQADAPLSSPAIAPALGGAFADALRRGR